MFPKRIFRCFAGNEPQPVSLLWLAEDYVVHMEHHLKQIVEY
jgi:hypothetical protein